MENVTESDVQELINAYRRAYTQGRDQFGEKSIQFRILQAILRASAQNTHDWIELNAASTRVSREELQSYAATLAKGDIIGTTANKLTPTAALKTGIRAAQRAVLHHVIIASVILVFASGIVWSGAATGHLLTVGLFGGGAIAGAIFWGLRGLARSAPQAGNAAVTAVKTANQLSQPAQNIFESQTAPTLARFYGRFNRPAPRTPMVAWINRTATGTLILMYLLLALLAVFFMFGFLRSIAELGNDCNFTHTCLQPIHLK